MSKRDDDRYDYLDYAGQLSDYEREFIEQFYKEYYFNGKPAEGKEKIITDKDMQQEANRHNNSYGQDLLFRAKKDGNLQTMNENARQFMEDAHDEWEWEDAFKQGGFELAIKVITEQTIRDLENSKLDKTVVLTRYYEKREKLRKQMRREKRK